MLWYEKYKDVFLLFWAIPFVSMLSPVDVTLYFNDLDILDSISRACWSNNVCSLCMVVFTTSINYWTDNEHRDRKQATKRILSYTKNIYLFHDKYMEIDC